MEIRGLSPVGLLGARVYLREADAFAPGQRRAAGPRKKDGVSENNAPRQVVDVIDLRTAEARRATESQRAQDTRHRALKPNPGPGQGAFLDITV